MNNNDNVYGEIILFLFLCHVIHLCVLDSRKNKTNPEIEYLVEHSFLATKNLIEIFVFSKSKLHEKKNQENLFFQFDPSKETLTNLQNWQQQKKNEIVRKIQCPNVI